MNNSHVSTEADLLNQLKQQENNVEFEQVMQVIADNYQYQPTAFTNGLLVNEAGSNEGSCKIFYFAFIHKLNPQQTLACFGRYYREDVLKNPTGDDHGNIRNFMKTGWQGIEFPQAALISLQLK